MSVIHLCRWDQNRYWFKKKVILRSWCFQGFDILQTVKILKTKSLAYKLNFRLSLCLSYQKTCLYFLKRAYPDFFRLVFEDFTIRSHPEIALSNTNKVLPFNQQKFTIVDDQENGILEFIFFKNVTPRRNMNIFGGLFHILQFNLKTKS
jgi:hypothetical protein